MKTISRREFVQLKDGQSVSEKSDEYRVIAVRRGNTVDVIRVYPNRYVDESDPAYHEIHPYVQKRCPWGTYDINEYKTMVASYGNLVEAF